MPGGPEVFVCLLVALVVIGPHRLPEAARKFGAALAKFRSKTGGMRDEIRGVVEPVNKIRSEIRSTIRETTGFGEATRPSIGDPVPTLTPRPTTINDSVGSPPPLTDEEIELPAAGAIRFQRPGDIAPPSQTPDED
jgi:Sec-independent protein translocase protein TatA